MTQHIEELMEQFLKAERKGWGRTTPPGACDTIQTVGGRDYAVLCGPRVIRHVFRLVPGQEPRRLYRWPSALARE